MLTVLSLGAGVQSTTLALMAAHGAITPMPDCAIFADTGDEPRAVYKHLDWLETVLPFKVHRVSKGRSLRDDILAQRAGEKGRFAAVPFFTLSPRGKKGMGRRQCTREFKMEPIRQKQRELLGLKFRQRAPKGTLVEVWIGISTDEAQRMKPPFEPWQVNRWPLIEANMDRRACQAWLQKHYRRQAPKSACKFCPYHDAAGWRALEPDEFAEVVELDRLIRDRGTLRGMRAKQYVHASRKPLSEVDLSTAEERGQLNLFGNECEGMCGV